MGTLMWSYVLRWAFMEFSCAGAKAAYHAVCCVLKFFRAGLSLKRCRELLIGLYDAGKTWVCLCKSMTSTVRANTSRACSHLPCYLCRFGGFNATRTCSLGNEGTPLFCYEVLTLLRVDGGNPPKDTPRPSPNTATMDLTQSELYGSISGSNGRALQRESQRRAWEDCARTIPRFM